MHERLEPVVAEKWVKRILGEGTVTWSQHARDEMRADGLSTVDCVNVLRAGAIGTPPELERGSWRYHVQTQRICVVVAFRSEEELVVITTWRKRR